MKWTTEAESAIKKVPFFVRKKVRARVENEAKAVGKNIVGIDDVKATKAGYLSKMSSEIKGYQIDTCFGPDGCPNVAHGGADIFKKIEAMLKEEDLLSILKKRVNGDLKFHHEFRLTLSDCPNACSQPQIKDIGIIGACIPRIGNEECTLCKACLDICKENAVTIDENEGKPALGTDLCINCGQCIDACPTGTIEKGASGFRVLLGGKLGRHPRLAKELPGIHDEEGVIKIVKECIDFYKKNSRHGERFAEIFWDSDFERNGLRARAEISSHFWRSDLG